VDHQPVQNRPEQPESMGPTMVLCPYCGSLSAHNKQCAHCSGHFDLLSRQRSQNAMGPWFIRDVSRPFQPGCSLSTLSRMAQRGRIKPETVIRGPSTRQFWTFAKNTPGISHFFGECHSCHSPVMPISKLCPSCNASFVADDDRQNLGLSPVHLLPGDADAATIAASLGTKGPHPTIPTQTPLPMPVAPPSQPAESENAPEVHPEPPFPIPEVRVISADEQAGKPVALLVGIAVAAILVSGVGFWAWDYISSLSEDVQDNAEVVSVESDNSSSAIEPVVDQNPPATQLAVDNPASELLEEDLQIPAAQDAEPVETPVEPDPLRAADLAYDRALLGIVDGSLNDAEFAELADQISNSRREQLFEVRRLRNEQIRLGRAGN
jgi:hypothetical protein